MSTERPGQEPAFVAGMVPARQPVQAGALSQAGLLCLEPVGPELAAEDQDSTTATGGHRMCLKV